MEANTFFSTEVMETFSEAGITMEANTSISTEVMETLSEAGITMETNTFISTEVMETLSEAGITKEIFIETVLNGYFVRYVSMTLIILSTVGNCLSYLVYSRPKFQASTTGFYFRILAIADTLACHTQCWYLLVNDGYVTGLFTTSKVFCKLWMFMIWVFRDFAAWILILISIERYVVVAAPHKAKTICTKKKAIISLICVFILLLTLNIPLILSSSQRWIQDSMRCAVRGNSNMVKFMQTIFRWIDITKYTIIPFSTMIFCNMYIITIVTKAAIRRRRNLATGRSDSGTTVSTMTANLLVVSFAFLILSIPTNIFFISIPISVVSQPNRLGAQMNLFRTVALQVANLNNCINVFLYCAAGATFRQELKALLCGRPNNNMEHSSMTVTAASSVADSKC